MQATWRAVWRALQSAPYPDNQRQHLEGQHEDLPLVSPPAEALGSNASTAQQAWAAAEAPAAAAGAAQPARPLSLLDSTLARLTAGSEDKQSIVEVRLMWCERKQACGGGGVGGRAGLVGLS